MPAKINFEVFLEKVTLPQLITPDRLNDIFISTLPSEERVKIEKEYIKPYTISYPRFFYPDKELISNFTVEITVLEDRLLSYIVDILSIPPEKLIIGDVHIEKIKIKNLEEEDFTGFLEGNEPVQDVVIDFVTPTILTKNNLEYILPDPEVLFTDTLNKWNRYSDKKITFEKNWLLFHINITGAFIRTRHIDLPNLPQKTGFTGKIFLFFNTKSHIELNKLHALRRFMEYSHAGRFNEFGFGKVITA